PAQSAEYYRYGAEKLGLDKPVFYFKLTSAAFPKTLWKIYPLERRKRLTSLIAQTGNWQAVETYDAALNRSLLEMERISDSCLNVKYLRQELLSMSTLHGLTDLIQPLSRADSLAQTLPVSYAGFLQTLTGLKSATQQLQTTPQKHLLYIPVVYWYGLNNQYHHWFYGFLTGNWGLTKQQKPLWEELKPNVYATFALSGISLLLAFTLAIPLGVEMARNKGGLFDRWAKRILFFLHAMPTFWLGALLMILFTSSLLGKPLIANPYLDVTDSWNPHVQSFGSWLALKMPKFALPITVLTLYSLTVITMQMRGGMLGALNQDFVRTARAKGVKEEEVYWKHAFYNALFPVITIFGSVWPALLSGSLVIETMFNFPGMGLKTQSAFTGHDLSVLSAILMAAATMTILGNLVADLLYAWVDPRVKFSK
ncbi:MAG: ABC transporter permease, partial [Saprospiraceae bacterium]|nr:ABC transporter permease [Saprospiraceae bacterium]